MGFCWGGSRSFGYATHQPGLDAAVVYYGSSPDEEALVLVSVSHVALALSRRRDLAAECE